MKTRKAVCRLIVGLMIVAVILNAVLAGVGGPACWWWHLGWGVFAEVCAFAALIVLLD